MPAPARDQVNESITDSRSLATRKDMAPGRSRRSWRAADELLPRWLSRAIRVFLLIVIAIPVCYLVILSISPEISVDAGKLFPAHPTLSNYSKAWSEVGLLRGFLNSVVTCGTAALVCVLIATAAAFPLARYRFKGAGALFYGTLGLQLVPSPMILLPLFVIYSMLQILVNVSIVGSYWGLIVTFIAFSLPLCMWLMVGYVRTIPQELDEAASVDGASGLRTFRWIILPLAVPGMVVAFVLALLAGWNDVLFASVLTNESTRTIAVDLQLFTLQQGEEVVPQYANMMATGVMIAVPVVLVYLVLQRYLVGGLAGGAVK